MEIFSIPMHPSTRGTMIRRSASRYRGIGVPRAQSVPATQEFSFFLDISSAVWHTYICQVLSVILLVGRKEGRRPAIPPRERVTKTWVFFDSADGQLNERMRKANRTFALAPHILKPDRPRDIGTSDMVCRLPIPLDTLATDMNVGQTSV